MQLQKPVSPTSPFFPLSWLQRPKLLTLFSYGKVSSLMFTVHLCLCPHSTLAWSSTLRLQPFEPEPSVPMCPCKIGALFLYKWSFVIHLHLLALLHTGGLFLAPSLLLSWAVPLFYIIHSPKIVSRIPKFPTTSNHAGTDIPTFVTLVVTAPPPGPPRTFHHPDTEGLILGPARTDNLSSSCERF